MELYMVLADWFGEVLPVGGCAKVYGVDDLADGVLIRLWVVERGRWLVVGDVNVLGDGFELELRWGLGRGRRVSFSDGTGILGGLRNGFFVFGFEWANPAWPDVLLGVLRFYGCPLREGV